MEAVRPAPLGAAPREGGVDFALYSSVAERVELCLFGDGRDERRIELAPDGDDVWRGFVPGAGPGQRYGYRVHGPWDPVRGLRCNPAKLLIDPYARLLSGHFRWDDAVFDYLRDHPDRACDLDSARFVPKSVVTAPAPPVGGQPKIRWGETIFYELNVRGFTMRHPALDESERGTFSGLSNADVVGYLKSLGVTSIELMPTAAFIDEHHLAKLGLRNYWGYNTIAFFAPQNRYAGSDPLGEFRDMVRTLHDAGLEVILDVVFNHTAEGDRYGPALSFRGIDNLAYYRVEPDTPSEYVNDTGTGNTVNTDHPMVRRLVLDSLRYWSSDMGVDGFRFDLATVLGRHADGFSADHPLLREIGNDPELGALKLVAEPWDPGPGGYQLGSFPPPFAEWNDRFRDAARRFWRGDERMSGELARRLRGSADLFEASGRRPAASVNLVSAHDGFTLADVAAYEERHNHANGENNRDGHSHNYSINHGVEGPTDDERIVAARKRHCLNLLATLFFAQGTPLLLAGDEFGQTQSGNNNAYAQDNETAWLDWTLHETNRDFTDAVRKLIRLRLDMPLVHFDEYVHGVNESGDGNVSISWINPDGGAREDKDWGFGHAFGLLIDERDEVHRIVGALFNAWHDALDFRLPATPPGQEWRVEFCSAIQGCDLKRDMLAVEGRSIVLLRTA